ncbi:Major facilitator superfamily domain containing protein [Rhypophila decipiens]
MASSLGLVDTKKEEEGPGPHVQVDNRTSFADVGADTVTPVQQWSPDEERKLVRKLDLTLIPGLWILQVLSHLDRSNIGNARIAGMSKDLDLSSSQFSMIIVVFYISYIPASPLGNMLVVRTRPSILLPFLVVSWGIITCGQGLAKTYPQLIVLRVLMGALETSLQPACIMLLSSWYRPSEQAKRAVAYTSSTFFGGAFGGLLAGAITGNLEGARGIRGWKWLFLIEGVITIFLGLISIFLIPDFPENSRRFDASECQIATLRMKQADVTGYSGKALGGKKMSKVESVLVVLCDWRVWAITFGTMVLGCSYVLPYFYPTLVKGMGYSNLVTAQYMTVPIWIVALVWSIGICIIADRMHASRALFISVSMGYAMIMTVAVCCVYGYVERYALLIIMATGVWSTLPIGSSFAATTFRDMAPEARAIAVACTSAGSQVGNIYGAYLFPAEAGPKYLFGFGTIAGTQCLGSLVFFCIFILLRRRDANSKSVAACGSPPTINNG